MTRKSTTAEFVLKARQVHGWRYDYSNVNYVNNTEQVCIVCTKHGEFWQRPSAHLLGSGCPVCGRLKAASSITDDKASFINKARKTHGQKYDYSKVEYKGTYEPVCITCPKHGEFWQKPCHHVSKSGCPECAKEAETLRKQRGVDSFLREAIEVHGDKYDYSKVDAKNGKQKVCIICPQHGEFWQTLAGHIKNKTGCPKCAVEYVAKLHSKDDEWFLRRSREIHGDKYDYSKAHYTASNNKICIICHERDEDGNEHGEFWTTASSHINMKTGCPSCSLVKRGGRNVGIEGYTTEWFIKASIKVHGEKYDYSHTEYTNVYTPVTMICPDHGPFAMLPKTHLAGSGCPRCNGKQLTTEDIVDLFRMVHGDRYDYSRVSYVDKHTKVSIICPIHGEFCQQPSRHLKGVGCPTCGIGKLKSNKEEFVEEARKVHGDKYDYSQVDYRGMRPHVRIVCPEHGAFLQSPVYHLRGSQCPKCAGRVKYDAESFIIAANKIHRGKYSYDKLVYDYKSKVCITCPEHGDFMIRANYHLRGGGCPICAGRFIDTQTFIEKANLVHNGKFDYHKVVYVNGYTKVCITCPKHGDFWQTPSQHLGGNGCSKCAGLYMDTVYFIEKSTKKHAGKYDYSLVKYKNSHSKVTIICPKHGPFEQMAYMHLQGNGCPKCNESHLELDVRKFLKRKGIKMEYQKTFDWLVYAGNMFLDFFLPDYSLAIECQGVQHFRPTDYFGGEEPFRLTQRRDIEKRRLCKEHGIKVIYYADLGIKYPYPVMEDLDQLYKAIMDRAGVDNSYMWKDPELPFDVI